MRAAPGLAAAVKVEHVAEWRGSDLYSRRERLALELTERMTHTPRPVSESFFARLQREFSNEELEELAAVIALENFRSKFNPVFGVESGESCALPWVRDAAAQAATHLR
jgi:alkylhydroperoxidase family enzyme